MWGTAVSIVRAEELAKLVEIHVRLGWEALCEVNKTSARIVVPLPLGTIEWEVLKLEARFLEDGRWSCAQGRRDTADVWRFELQPYGDTPPLTVARMLVREAERAEGGGQWRRKCGVRTPLWLSEDERREAGCMLATRGWGTLTMTERKHQFYGMPMFLYRVRRSSM